MKNPLKFTGIPLLAFLFLANAFSSNAYASRQAALKVLSKKPNKTHIATKRDEAILRAANKKTTTLMVARDKAAQKLQDTQGAVNTAKRIATTWQSLRKQTKLKHIVTWSKLKLKDIAATQMLHDFEELRYGADMSLHYKQLQLNTAKDLEKELKNEINTKGSIQSARNTGVTQKSVTLATMSLWMGKHLNLLRNEMTSSKDPASKKLFDKTDNLFVLSRRVRHIAEEVTPAEDSPHFIMRSERFTLLERTQRQIFSEFENIKDTDNRHLVKAKLDIAKTNNIKITTLSPKLTAGEQNLHYRISKENTLKVADALDQIALDLFEALLKQLVRESK